MPRLEEMFGYPDADPNPSKSTKTEEVCPQCHDHATTLRRVDLIEGPVYQCPNCSSIFEMKGTLLTPIQKAEQKWQDVLRSAAAQQTASKVSLSYANSPQHLDNLVNELNAAADRGEVHFSVHNPEPQELVAGLQFSKVPKFELAPRVAMLRLIRRIEYGEITKGKNAWNAASDNQEALADRTALAKRLGHAINHAYNLLEKLYSGVPLYDLSKNDDDAAALMWAGMYACCATDAMEKTSEDPHPETTQTNPVSGETSP